MVTVKVGDTLNKIVSTYNRGLSPADRLYTSVLEAFNISRSKGSIRSGNPALIYPGERIYFKSDVTPTNPVIRPDVIPGPDVVSPTESEKSDNMKMLLIAGLVVGGAWLYFK